MRVAGLQGLLHKAWRWQPPMTSGRPVCCERKRMFIAMKREVLRIGGYTQEFFVSQTPELAAMADAITDLEAFRSVPQSEANLLS